MTTPTPEHGPERLKNTDLAKAQGAFLRDYGVTPVVIFTHEQLDAYTRAAIQQAAEPDLTAAYMAGHAEGVAQGIAKAGAVPAGFRLVPVEPTVEMTRATAMWLKNIHLMRAIDRTNAIHDAYTAMLNASPTPPVGQLVAGGRRELPKLTIVGMATAAHAIDFWDEHFDYVNSHPIAHSDMMEVARILRNPGEEIARLRGEIGVICGLMDQALDVMQTVDGDDDDEDRKILRLRAKMASAIDHFRRAEFFPPPPAHGINPVAGEGKVSDHRHTSAWFQRIANVTVEQFPSRAAAFQAETVAIRTENPLFNIAKVKKP